MRISDWSSDVCSSDLQDAQRRAHRAAHPAQMADGGLVAQPRRSEEELFDQDAFRRGRSLAVPFQNKGRDRARPLLNGLRAACYAASFRSEEHTSELQSLMRISYAVCCLKKKKHITHH